MIVLEAVILVIGFTISIVTLFTKKLERNNKVKKILAGLYLFVCALSVLILVLNSSNDENNSFTLFQELNEIGNAIEIQSDSIHLILNKTHILYRSLDSININTKHIIEQRERSQKVFQEQNMILEKSNDLTQKKINAEKPNIVVYGSEVKFTSIDSLKSECDIVYENIGKRTASNFSNKIIFVFKNKNGEYFIHGETGDPPSNNDRFIYPGSVITTTSHINLGYEQILNLTSGGTIIITCEYYDEILDKRESKEYRFEFTNNWSGNNILKNENTLEEKGLDNYLKKKNIPH